MAEEICRSEIVWLEIPAMSCYAWQLAAWVSRKTCRCCSAPSSASICEGASRLALPCSWCPAAGVRAESVGGTRPVFQRLEKSGSLDSRRGKEHESLLLTNNILSVSVSAGSQRCDFGGRCCNPVMAWWLRAFDFTQPSSVPRPYLSLPCPSAVFIPLLLPETGRRGFPSHPRGAFSSEWSCIARRTQELVAQQYCVNTLV